MIKKPNCQHKEKNTDQTRKQHEDLKSNDWERQKIMKLWRARLDHFRKTLQSVPVEQNKKASIVIKGWYVHKNKIKAEFFTQLIFQLWNFLLEILEFSS